MPNRPDLDRRGLIVAGVAGAVSLSLAGCAARATGGTRSSSKKKPLSILVMGGTGFLGPHFVEAARAAGHRLTLFNRGKSNPTRFSGEEFTDIEQLRGDRKTGLAALQGDRRWDAVLDTSAYLPADVTRSAGMLAKRVGHYLVVSSISVYARNDTPGADETAAVGTIADPATTEITGESYGPLKALCEQAAEKAMPGRAIVVRPGLIVGPGDTTDRFTYWPARADRGGEILAPGSAADPLQVIDVRDLAAFLLTLIEDGSAGVFNADAPPATLTMGQLVDGSRAAAKTTFNCVRAPCPQPAGNSSTVTWVPADFLAAQKVSPWADMPAWLPPTGEYAGWGQRSTARAQVAGLRNRPLQQTIEDTLAWWRSLPDERKAKPKAGIAPAREAEVLAAWHAGARKAG